MLRNIVSLAEDYKWMPSKMYRAYLKNPKDILLLIEYRDYKDKLEKKETERIKKEQESEAKRNLGSGSMRR